MKKIQTEFLRMTAEEIDDLSPEKAAQWKERLCRGDMTALLEFALACLNTYVLIAVDSDIVPARDRRLLLDNGKSAIAEIEGQLRKEESIR